VISSEIKKKRATVIGIKIMHKGQFMLCKLLPELEELIVRSCDTELVFHFDAILRLGMRQGSTQVFKFSVVPLAILSTSLAILYFFHIRHCYCMSFFKCYYLTMGRESVVSLATRYGLDGPGIESWWGVRFSTPVQTSHGAHPASYTLDTVSFPRLKQLGRSVDRPYPSSFEVEEIAELYFYSLSGPSWSVLG
jgi:hypothetical protein